jgi:regulator of nonsense transcripts 3
MASSTSVAGTRAQNGVLPMPVTQTSTNAPRPTATRQSSQKLKLIVRRLAPALTETEFLAVIGDDWKAGNGKVDWFRYQAGKDSKECVICLICHV